MKTPKFARWGRGIAGALSLTLLFSLSAAALEPYRNYTYDSEENAWVEPQAYYAADILRGGTLGTADFHKPQDVFVAPDGRVYIADTGNNRIDPSRRRPSPAGSGCGYRPRGARQTFLYS